MQFNRIFYLISACLLLFLFSCHKEETLKATMKNPDISSQNPEERVIYIEETKGTKKKNTFYIEKLNKYITNNTEGYEFVLYDVNNNNFNSTIRIYQFKDTLDADLLDSGTRYTTSAIPPVSTSIGVQLNYYSDNVTKFFRAIDKKPDNKVKISNIDAETMLLEFSISEMVTNSSVGTNYPIKATGRIRIKNSY